MNSSFRRINAIFIKELQDIKSNTNVVFMYLLPIIIVFIYKQFIPDFPSPWILGFGLTTLIGTTGIYIPAMLIAEEKEKKTLGALMLSPARPIEVFAGKGLLTFITTIPIVLIILFASGNNLKRLDVVLVSAALTAVSCIFLGMIVGLLSQNQMATGIFGFPFILPFIMLPLLSILGNTVISRLALFAPTYYLFQMINLGIKGRTLLDMIPYIGALLGMILITFAVLLVAYKKKGLEQ